jgi:protease-4
MSDVPSDPMPPPPAGAIPPPAGPRPPGPPAPPRYFYPPPPPRVGSPLLGCAFGVSLLVNVLAAALVVLLCLGLLGRGASLGGAGAGSGPPIVERYHSGKATSPNKVAVIHLDGVLVEGLLGFAHKEIETAAEDKGVKAVVVRINSPGGSITASDELHRRLTELAQGNPEKRYDAKPLVVSMGAVAASGGYYVAMPAKHLFAERTTVTGSIGVYAAFPNVKKLADDWGVTMTIIKQGAIKDSGSMFKDMTPEERRVWQDMVDHSYRQFLAVVEQGRPDQLKGKLLEPVTVQPVNAGPPDRHNGPDGGKPGPYQRYRADGGVFTADEALRLGLVDKVGYLDDAIKQARDLASLGEDYHAVEYERLRGLSELLFGAQSSPAAGLDPARLGEGLTPRLWYLAPGCDLAGILSAAAAR